MSEPHVVHFRARWADMDFNQHMRNAAFLGCSEQTRMEFLHANGFTMDRFKALQLGPVVLEDRLEYKREIGLLVPFRVDLQVSSITEDGARMKVRNRFFLEDGTLAATVESVVLWFDLAARKPVAPPEPLRALWLGAARTDDFELWARKK